MWPEQSLRWYPVCVLEISWKKSCLLRWRCVIPVSGYRKKKGSPGENICVHRRRDTGAVYKNHLDICNRMDRRPAFESGGAGLVSTIDDYSHFAQMLLNGGSYKGKQILGSSVVEFLTGHVLSECQQKVFEREECRGWKDFPMETLCVS